jgi:hypothetical protein
VVQGRPGGGIGHLWISQRCRVCIILEFGLSECNFLTLKSLASLISLKVGNIAKMKLKSAKDP